ncbi:MAG: hypothetical protein JWN85_1045 [Gammaproteobacteria bacterium]|nr:hypothetical protein [Gammaproteobacteria bacterium]
MADHAITDRDGATVGETTPASAVTRTQARSGTAATAAVATIVIAASAVKAVSAVRGFEQRVAAEAAATEVVRVTVRPSVAATVKDRVARVATSRALAPTRVRASRMSGLSRLAREAASIKARELRFAGIRTGAPTPVPAQTRAVELTRGAGSTRAHAATQAAPIRPDGLIRARAPNRSGALIKTIGRTKALYATISATALPTALVPTSTAMRPVVVSAQIAMVANVVAAEDADAADAAVAAEAKAGIATVHRRAEHLRALGRRLPGQKTRLPRKPRRYRRVTGPIAMKTLVMRTLAMRTMAIIKLLKRDASGSRTIVRPCNRSSVRRNRNTRSRDPRTGTRRLHHNM